MHSTPSALQLNHCLSVYFQNIQDVKLYTLFYKHEFRYMSYMKYEIVCIVQWFLECIQYEIISVKEWMNENAANMCY